MAASDSERIKAIHKALCHPRFYDGDMGADIRWLLARVELLSDVRSSQVVEQARDRVITQAFVAGQMDAQLKHADDLTRPSLALLKERTYCLALESADDLIRAVRSEAVRFDPTAKQAPPL